MIHHTKAVSMGAKNTLLIGDMPFMFYQTSVYDAFKNGGGSVQE
jgi:3-methyl-2-oxobutanoate hydroxymethyltransferase